MHPFRAAVEKRDVEGFPLLLARDVEFLSPVAFKPYVGRELVAAILRGVMRVFEDLHYVNEIHEPGGHDVALVFKATVNGREVHGCDFLHLDDDGLIDRFCVMVRPLSAANALADAMTAQFDDIKREAGVA
ncbi:nuclear transport factor 2 family protein [Spirillospora sp. NPDC048911]|uniref:nuclear transport factor 2 family protein n=1 Tax=Spirillospora sp. NPDC048911 TaxID=3364527 RepID=UPI00371EC2EB